MGVRLAPYWHDGDRFVADEPLLADYDALVAELDERPVSYLHLRGRDPIGPDAAPDIPAFARYRSRFAGPLIVNNGFDRATGNAAVAAGVADAVSYARHYVANPDLVARFALDLRAVARRPGHVLRGRSRGVRRLPGEQLGHGAGLMARRAGPGGGGRRAAVVP